MTNKPVHILLQVVQWANRGYVMPDNAEVHAMPTFYAVKLDKPAPAASAKASK